MLTILFWNFVWKQNTISLSIQYATCELTSEARVPWLCPPLPCTLLLPSLSPPCPLLSTKRNRNCDPLEASHRLCPLLILDWESEERENKEHAERHFYFVLFPLSPVSSLYSSTAVIALLCTRLLSSLFSVLFYVIMYYCITFCFGTHRMLEIPDARALPSTHPATLRLHGRNARSKKWLQLVHPTHPA